MENILDIPLLLIPLILPIALGYLFKRVRVFSHDDNVTLRKFVVKVSVPFLIFKNLYRADVASIGQFLPMALAFTLLTVLFTLSGHYLSPLATKEKLKQNAAAVAMIMGNYMFLGWGVMYIFYGQEALTRAIFFVVPFWPVFLTCGFWLVHQRERAGNKEQGSFLSVMAQNASVPIAATIISLAMNLLKVPVPKELMDLVDTFGSFTIPLILFTIGLSFKFMMPLSNIKIIAYAAGYRLIFGFFIGLAVMLAVHVVFPLDPISRKVILNLAPMPGGAMVVIFIPYIKLDTELMSGYIGFSTLVSMATIPLWYMVVEQFF